MSHRARTMKCAVVSQLKQPFKIEKVPIPEPKPDEILVKIKASGCCHTDLHAIEGDWPVKPKMPLTPGHEGAGVVEALGANVTNWNIGDKVGIPWLYEACGECEYCVAGWETLCTKQNNTGYSVDGCFREYAIAKASHAIPLPQKVSFEQCAPVLCAGVTSYKGLKETETKPGEFCTIVGAAGGLGHLAVQYAKAMGMRPIAVDMGAQKKKHCLDMGAEHFVDAKEGNAAAQVNELTNGGSHGVLCLATSTPAFETAVNSCRRKGCVVCVGLPPGGFPTPIFDVVLKRVTIRGSIVGTRMDCIEALDFVERGLVKCDIQTKKIEALNDIYGKLKKNQVTGRMVLKMDDHH